MVRRRHLIALVSTFLIGCAVLLLVVGCAGVRSEAPEEQGHTEVTEAQARSPEGAESEETRCDGTRTYKREGAFRGDRSVLTTNDVPGCPKGGLLLGTDSADKLDGKKGDDEIRGLGAADGISGGVGKDIIYGGPGDDVPLGGRDGDDVIYGGPGNDSEVMGDKGDDVIYGGDGDDDWLDGTWGKDVIYGGDGNDSIVESVPDGQPDKLYCGKGKDRYYAAEKIDHVDSSCEKKTKDIGFG